MAQALCWEVCATARGSRGRQIGCRRSAVADTRYCTVHYVHMYCTVRSQKYFPTPPNFVSTTLLHHDAPQPRLKETSLGLLDLVVLLRMSGTYLSEP